MTKTTTPSQDYHTAAVVTVKEMQGALTGEPVAHIRRDINGTPTRVLPDLFKALPLTLPLPSFDPGSFAAALIGAWVSGNPLVVTLVKGYDGEGALWRYEITKSKTGPHLVVRVFRWCDGSTRKGVRQGWFEVFYGILREAVLYADLIEEAGNAKPMERVNQRTAEFSFWGAKEALAVEDVSLGHGPGDGFHLTAFLGRASVAYETAPTLGEAFALGRKMAKDRDAKKSAA